MRIGSILFLLLRFLLIVLAVWVVFGTVLWFSAAAAGGAWAMAAALACAGALWWWTTRWGVTVTRIIGAIIAMLALAVPCWLLVPLAPSVLADLPHDATVDMWDLGDGRHVAV